MIARQTSWTRRRSGAFTLIELPFDKLRVVRQRGRVAFTLIELLVVIAIIAVLAGILMPSLASARQLARKAVCSSNLRSMQAALSLYLEDNNRAYFPYQEMRPDGTLWYWGFEPSNSGATEGTRPLDLARARLAPYFTNSGKMKICPNVPREASYFKPKFGLAGYGYAINYQMLPDVGGGSVRFDQITRPSETVAWADSVQINTWQAPASPSNPMLEDWYYLDNHKTSPADFHFRHQKLCNAVFADGSVRDLAPVSLDARCDGLVGRPEDPVTGSQVPPLLKLDK